MVDQQGEHFELQHFHRQMLNAMAEHRFLLIEAFRGSGKALALDTPIPTPKGWTTMGNISTGDILLDEKGTPCTVLAISEIMLGRPCYRLEFSGGASLIADAEHQWLTTARVSPLRDQSPRTDIRTTQEIEHSLHTPYKTSSGYAERNHRVVATKALQLPRKRLSVHPYVLGCWLGDGSSYGSDITIYDTQIVSEIAKYETIKPVRRTTPNVYRIGSGGLGQSQADRKKSFQGRLRKLNLISNKHIPKKYLRGSRSQRLSLLQGLMDTDGYATTDGDCEFTNTNKSLAEQVYELAASLGFIVSWSEGRATLDGKDCGAKYRIRFRAYSSQPVFRLTRKQRRLPSSKRHRKATWIIKNVEQIPSIATRCIMVDSPSGLFLAGKEMIPTHNSRLGSVCYPLWRIMRDRDVRIMLVSESDKLAKDWLKEIENYMVSEPYKKLVGGDIVPDSFKERLTWTSTEKIVRGRSPNAQGSTLLAVGVAGQIRGRRMDVVILDDPNTETNSHTLYQRSVLSDWFHAALLPTLDHNPADPISGQIIVLGTPLYDNDLLSDLRGNWGPDISKDAA